MGTTQNTLKVNSTKTNKRSETICGEEEGTVFEVRAPYDSAFAARCVSLLSSVLCVRVFVLHVAAILVTSGHFLFLLSHFSVTLQQGHLKNHKHQNCFNQKVQKIEITRLIYFQIENHEKT